VEWLLAHLHTDPKEFIHPAGLPGGLDEQQWPQEQDEVVTGLIGRCAS
jgi:hypothetical protein